MSRENRWRLSADLPPSASLHWGVNVTRLADGWHVGVSLELTDVLRFPNGDVEDYELHGDLGVFDCGPFISAEDARDYAELMLGGAIDWAEAGSGHALRWRGFRDVTVEANSAA